MKVKIIAVSVIAVLICLFGFIGIKGINSKAAVATTVTETPVIIAESPAVKASPEKIIVKAKESKKEENQDNDIQITASESSMLENTINSIQSKIQE